MYYVFVSASSNPVGRKALHGNLDEIRCLFASVDNVSVIKDVAMIHLFFFDEWFQFAWNSEFLM